MRLLIQVVKEAKVTVDNACVGAIHRGVVVFFAATQEDSSVDVEWLADKLVQLRIFPDAKGKMNLSLKETEGAALVVSQFTLYADCSHGRRPSFTQAAAPPFAKELYEQFITAVKARLKTVETGIFGAYMVVSLANDGPVTFLIDSKETSCCSKKK